MSYTENLKLFKNDNPTSNKNNFDVDKSLNKNWDVVDEFSKEETKLLKETQTRQDLLEKKYKEQIENIAGATVQNQEIVDARKGFENLGNTLKQKIYHFNTVAEMKECINLEDGDVVSTNGFFKENDGGSSTYKIVNNAELEENDINIFNIANELKAVKIDSIDTNKLIFMPVDYEENDNASGDCTVLLVNKSKKVVMFDTGRTQAYSLIKEQLNLNNISHIDYLIISHFHEDHIMNYTSLIDENYIDEKTVVYLPKMPATDKVTNVTKSVVENFKSALSEVNCSIIYPNSSDILNIDDITITFLNCNDEDIAYYDENTTDYNNYSICNYIISENFKVLMTGDIQEIAQKYLIEKRYIEKCDILKMPHHSWESSSGDDNFYFACRPCYAITSINSYSYQTSQAKSSRAIGSLNNINTKCYITGNGTINVNFKKDNYTLISNGLEVTSAVEHNFNLYVNSEYANSYCDGTQQHPFKNIQSALGFAKALNKNQYVTINFLNDYVDTGSVNIRNVSSVIQIGKCTLGQVKIDNSTVIMNDVTISNAVNGALDIYYSNVELNNCVINGNVRNASSYYNGRGLRAYYSSIYLNNCTISNKRVAISLYNGTSANISQLKGTNNEYTILPHYSTFANITLNEKYESEYPIADANGTVHGDIKNDTNLKYTNKSVSFGNSNKSIIEFNKSGNVVCMRVSIAFEDIQQKLNQKWTRCTFPDVIPDDFLPAFITEDNLFDIYTENNHVPFIRLEGNSRDISISTGEYTLEYNDSTNEAIKGNITYLTNIL